jgi:signal transduction histidine kinase
MSWSLGLRTTTARLTVFYVAVFGGLTLLAVAIVYISSSRLAANEMSAALREQALGLSDVFRDEGAPGVRAEIERRVHNSMDPEALYALWSANGSLIAGNVSPSIQAPEFGPEQIQLRVENGSGAGATAHAAIALVERLSDRSVLLVGRDVEARQSSRNQALRVIWLTFAVMAVLGFGGALIGGRHLLRRVNAVATTARQIAEGQWQQRVPVHGSDDEFDRLALAVNAMLERLEDLTTGMRAVIDSVAHDLRRPLTHARQAFERASRAPAAANADWDEVGTALDAMQSTLAALLHLVEAESGASRTQMEPVCLSQLVRDLAELYEPLTEDAGLQLQLDLPETAPTLAHRELLAQAVANLLDNAIKYAARSGVLRVAVGTLPGKIRITVADRGPGIAPEMRERALARFVRLSDDPQVSGSGLGLSLVAAVARLHRGHLELGEAGPGLIATLELPFVELDDRT